MPGLDRLVIYARTYFSRNETKIRFLFAGGLNTIVGLALFPLLMFVFDGRGVHYLVVLVISGLIGINFAFLTSKYFVFRTKGNLLKEYTKFVSFYLLYLIINLFALPVLVNFFDLSPIWAQFLFVMTTFIASWLWHSRITFLFHRKIS